MGYILRLWASLVAQMVKNLPAMRETWVRSLGWEDPLEKGTATFQYSGLENSMDRGAWRATVRGVTKSQTWLSIPSLLCTFKPLPSCFSKYFSPTRISSLLSLINAHTCQKIHQLSLTPTFLSRSCPVSLLFFTAKLTEPILCTSAACSSLSCPVLQPSPTQLPLALYWNWFLSVHFVSKYNCTPLSSS